MNIWNLDEVKLCKCSNLLSDFHNFAYEVSKVAFVIANFETSRSKQIRRGTVPQWHRSDFLVKTLIMTGANYSFPDLAIFCQIRKASNPLI